MKPSRLSTLVFLLTILFYWFPLSIQFLARRRFLKQARFVIDALHQLSITPIQIYNVSNSIACTFRCIEHDQCLSYNIAVNSTGGWKLCQLLSTDKYNSSTDFVSNTEFNYHHIDVGLKHRELNPCRNRGTLTPYYWTGSYKCSCPALNIEGKNCEWIKLNFYPVHVESKNDEFGPFKSIQSGKILRFKLVHISGGMSCWITEPGYAITKFGCGTNIAMYITNQANNVVSPGPDRVNSWMVYSLPGYTSNDTEIILPKIDPPLHVTAGQEFRLWYGEDMLDIKYEGDNVGTMDTNVFALYN